jgi:hypothetical protein
MTRRSGAEGALAMTEYNIGMSAMPWLLHAGQPPMKSFGRRPRA